ncbi:hypothetical protein KI387_033587, partial [Taxus chinensis]
TGKTFTAKMIFETLIRIYSNSTKSDPLKPKGLILAFTGKAAYNAGGTTFHSALLLPFNKSLLTPLGAERLDTLSKHYQQLQLVFIDEISLVGAQLLYHTDNRLRDIKQTPTVHFGNIDMVFCGDFYQAQPVNDCFVFEPPRIDKQPIPYGFWADKVK